MAERDENRELHRLAQRYATLTDEELLELADDAESLTEHAKEALRAEITRRGLALISNDPSPESWPGSLVLLRRYLWLHEALLSKTILDSAGIECLLVDEHTIRMDWFWSLALGEVKLLVRAEDADATELLDQGWIESFVVSGVGEYVQPRCPNCASFEISYRQLLKRLAYWSLAFFWLLSFVPAIAFRETAWRCRSCGHSWKGEIPPTAQPPDSDKHDSDD